MKVMIGKGKRVRDPETKEALKEGSVLEVKESSYWHRRIKDGDVTEVKEEPSTSKK